MKPVCACGGFWQGEAYVHAEACTEAQRKRWKAKFKQPSAKWEVKRGALLTDTHGKISVSCAHRKGQRVRGGACAGCYARLYIAIQLIEATPEAAAIIVKEVLDAQRAEEAARRLRGEATDF